MTREEFIEKCNHVVRNYRNVEEFNKCINHYPAHITGTRWSSEYAGDDYFRLFPQMVARLDSAEDSERAKEDRAYLEDWFFDAFGTYNIKYNFSNWLSEIVYMREEEQAIA